MPSPVVTVDKKVLSALHIELTGHFFEARQKTRTQEEAIALFSQTLKSSGYVDHFPEKVLRTAIHSAMTEVELNLRSPQYKALIGSMVPTPAPVQAPNPVKTPVPTPAPAPSSTPKILSLQEKMMMARSPQERGDVFAEAINRCRGIHPDKFSCVGIAIGNPRVTVYMMQQQDDGVTPLRGSKGFEALPEHFKLLGLTSGNRSVAIVPRDGYIAVEVPNLTWEPLLIDELIKQGAEPIPSAPLKIWIGRNTEGEVVEFNLSDPTGHHLSLAGMTGGGKSYAINMMFVGVILKYRSPWFCKFVIVDVQQVNAQHLEAFHPWFWKGLGVLSEVSDITCVLRFADTAKDDDADSPGLLESECKRREDLYLTARVSDLSSYNRVAYEDYKLWRSQGGVDPKALTIENYNKTVDDGFDRWRYSRDFQAWKQLSHSARKAAPRPSLPILEHIILLIDEAAGTKDLFGSKKSQFTQWLRKIAQEFRKFGIHLFGCTQRPSADNNGPYDPATREQFGHAICLKVRGESTSEMVLGKGNTMGCHLSDRGDAYVITPHSPEPMRVQLFLVEPTVIDSVAQQVMLRHGRGTMRTISQVQEQLSQAKEPC